MGRMEEYALDRYITSLPPDLWMLARAAFEELANSPFIPILSKDEIAKLVCSPGFQSYLEGEYRQKEQRLSCIYSA